MKTYWKPQHEVFVRGMLAHGDRIRAYREAYPNIFPTAVRQAAVRLMNHPEIRQHLEPVFEQAKAAAMQQLEQMAGQRIAGEMMSAYEQRVLLAQMIRGEIRLQRDIKLRNRIATVEQDLDPFVVLKAIELDCKLEAGYPWPAHKGIANAQLNSIMSYICSKNHQGVGVRKQFETFSGPNPLPARFSVFTHPPFLTKNLLETGSFGTVY